MRILLSSDSPPLLQCFWTTACTGTSTSPSDSISAASGRHSFSGTTRGWSAWGGSSGLGSTPATSQRSSPAALSQGQQADRIPGQLWTRSVMMCHGLRAHVWA